MLPRRSRRPRLPRRHPWGSIKAIGAAALLLLGLFWVTRYHAASSGAQCPSYCHTQSHTQSGNWRTPQYEACLVRNGPKLPSSQQQALLGYCRANPSYNAPAGYTPIPHIGPPPSTPYVPPPPYTPASSPQAVAPSAACQQVLAGGQAAVAGHPLGLHIYRLCAANPGYTYTHADLAVAHCLTTNGVAADAAWTDATTPGLRGSLLENCQANPQGATQTPATCLPPPPAGQHPLALYASQHCYTGATYRDLLVARCLMRNRVSMAVAWSFATAADTPSALTGACRANPAYTPCQVVTGHVTAGRVNPTVGLPLSTGYIRWVPAIVDSGSPVSWVRAEAMGGVAARPLGFLGSVLFPFFHNQGGTYKAQTVVVNLYLRGSSGVPLPVGATHLEELYGSPGNIPAVGLGLNTLHRVSMSTSGGQWTLTPPCA